jgi:hypothetical protein
VKGGRDGEHRWHHQRVTRLPSNVPRFPPRNNGISTGQICKDLYLIYLHIHSLKFNQKRENWKILKSRSPWPAWLGVGSAKRSAGAGGAMGGGLLVPIIIRTAFGSMFKGSMRLQPSEAGVPRAERALSAALPMKPSRASMHTGCAHFRSLTTGPRFRPENIHSPCLILAAT